MKDGRRLLEALGERIPLRIKELPRNFSAKGGSGRVRKEDIVLLQEDRRSRHMWKKARVEELKVGRDGVKRTAVVREANGTILVRPIQLVIPLEVDQGGEDVEDP
jgi:hypothetical protein